MSLDEYRLSAQLVGHSQDVRTVAIADNYIVSGSRDMTAKIWERNGNSYNESLTLINHTGYVSSICLLQDGKFICTSSMDKTIVVYQTGDIAPLMVLSEHEQNVSCLAAGTENDILLSGSWDHTAIVWRLSGMAAQPLVKLVGHENAVWAIATTKTGNIVTGGADTFIIFWNQAGEKLKVLKGHQQCVRSLAVLPDNSLLSASNDSIIKWWNEDGECLKDLSGHSNFIYSLALNPFVGENVFLSCGEDSTIRMWNTYGPMGKELTLPSQSVWCVVANPKNGDIISSSCDGIVRIFTKDPARYADAATLAAFDEAVEIRKRQAELLLGGVKVNELPGPEALLQKGREGQTKMIRYPNGKILCHQWTDGKWVEVGDVVGGSGGSDITSGKTLFEGKEYDYVFSIDVSDTQPQIKLPYNRGEDPWQVAQKFIHKHDLPQSYLEEVANFIQNSSGAPVMPAAPSGSYQDPFTGAGRYIPGSDTGFSSNVGNVDPFTGGSSYSTASASAASANAGSQMSGHNFDPLTGGSSYSTASNQTVPVNFVPRSGQNLDPLTGGSSHTSSGTTRRNHFPFTEYIVLDVCDASKVLTKLKEFNGFVEDAHKLTDNELEQAVKYAEGFYDSAEAAAALIKLFRWPREHLFPVLDILRMAVRNANACSELVSPDVLNLIVQNVGAAPPNRLMSIRCLSNMLIHSLGRDLIATFLPNVLTAISTTKEGTPSLQVAIASLLLNMSIVQQAKGNSEQTEQINETIIDTLIWVSDVKAVYRCYRAVGNLLCSTFGQTISAQIVSTDQVMDVIREKAGKRQPGAEEISEICNEIINAL